MWAGNRAGVKKADCTIDSSHRYLCTMFAVRSLFSIGGGELYGMNLEAAIGPFAPEKVECSGAGWKLGSVEKATAYN